MAKTKKYLVYRYSELRLTLRLSSGKTKKVDFLYGKIYLKKPANFTTNDPEIQKAIESHNWYNKIIFPEETDIEVLDKSSNDDIEAIHEITTAQAAKEWLITNKGAKSSELKNTESIIAFCEKAGVRFPDWSPHQDPTSAPMGPQF